MEERGVKSLFTPLKSTNYFQFFYNFCCDTFKNIGMEIRLIERKSTSNNQRKVYNYFLLVVWKYKNNHTGNHSY